MTNHQPYHHLPVLADEIITLLQPEPEKTYIDATIGGGGHTALLLAKGAHVLGIDQDNDALTAVKAKLSHPKLELAHANFAAIATKAHQAGLTAVDGILFDLGVSSYQLDNPNRGFSFQHQAPLDMRMDQQADIPTADYLVNHLTEDELFEILMTYAQEPKSRHIAHQIVTSRPITSTADLAKLVETVYQGKRGHLHPATLTFQALRIAVNQELTIIKPTLITAYDLLKPQGIVAVISFHQGEDRIVKRTFKQLQQTKQALISGRQPIVPTQSEIQINPRARSAKLRFVQKGTI